MATTFRFNRTRLWIQGAIWICFFAIFGVSMLLEQMGLLNTVDLGWVGGEDGTFWQFATNVWYLDLMAGLLFAVAAILGCIELLIRLMRGRSK